MEKRQRRGFFPLVPFFFRIVGMTLPRPLAAAERQERSD